MLPIIITLILLIVLFLSPLAAIAWSHYPFTFKQFCHALFSGRRNENENMYCG